MLSSFGIEHISGTSHSIDEVIETLKLYQDECQDERRKQIMRN